MEKIQYLKEKFNESVGVIIGFLYTSRGKASVKYRITGFTVLFMSVMVVLSLHFFSNTF